MKVFEVRSGVGGGMGHVPALAENVPQQVKSWRKDWLKYLMLESNHPKKYGVKEFKV